MSTPGTDSTARAEAARRILEDTAFQDAVQEYSKQLVHEWEGCTNRDRRDELWMQTVALKTVVNNLTGFIQSNDYNLKTHAKKGLFK